jgi:hypothetical protein
MAIWDEVVSYKNWTPAQQALTSARTPAEARQALIKAGVNAAGWTDDQVTKFRSWALGNPTNFITGVTTAAEKLNPLHWEIFGIELQYWLLIGGGLLVVNTLKNR